MNLQCRLEMVEFGPQSPLGYSKDPKRLDNRPEGPPIFESSRRILDTILLALEDYQSATDQKYE
jgi:hypothetical protein